ncbi:hypothetical protein V1511DRAFT_458297 [Dipodascopsis uninucleata]
MLTIHYFIIVAVLGSGVLIEASQAGHNVKVIQNGVPLIPVPPPAPGAASNMDTIINQFTQLGRSTVWNLVKTVHLEGDTGEPEGMVNLGEERFIISGGDYSVLTESYGTIINGTDRTPGAGSGHLLIYDGEGRLIANATMTKAGSAMYHLGGIDYDGTHIWATPAQYRPNSTAQVVKIDIDTFSPQILFNIDDHEGGIVFDQIANKVYLQNWGSRNMSIFSLEDLLPLETEVSGALVPNYHKSINKFPNPSFYIDYQDCKWLGRSARYEFRPLMMCSGVNKYTTTNVLGGLAIIDCLTGIPLYEVPITLQSELDVVVTMNPFDIDVVDGRIRVYFAPDQHNTTIYMYEPLVDSPYEFGGPW